MKKGSDMDAKETTEREVGRRLPYSDPHAPITSFRCDYALRKQGNEGEIWRQQHHGFSDRVVAWVKRKIFLYNVTTGLYMLDWWERYLFSILFLIFLLPTFSCPQLCFVHCSYLRSSLKVTRSLFWKSHRRSFDVHALGLSEVFPFFTNSSCSCLHN
jgi:hypothetical protein